MNRKVPNHESPHDDQLDRILSGEDELMPSSGFLSAVMERVQEESVAPPPIPFPWKRAVPGIILFVLVIGWGVVEFIRRGLPAIRQAASAPLPHVTSDSIAPFQQAGWVALALVISLVSYWLSMRMVSRSRLL